MNRHSPEKAVLIKELVIAFLVSFGLVFAVLIGTGTLFSGWHLVDDEEYSLILYLLKNGSSISDIIRSRLIEPNRFRPLYQLIRCLAVYFFGDNLFIFSVFHGCYAALTMWLLYYIGRILGASRFMSAMFSFLSLIGYQSCNWWKLGPQEMLGSLLLCIAFLFALFWIRGGGWFYGILSLLFVILMTMYKESFVLTIPFLFAYFFYEAAGKAQESFTTVVRHVIRKRGWYLLVLAILFVGMIAYIVLEIGSKAEYGAIDRAPLSVYIHNFIRDFGSGDLKWFSLFAVIMIMILLTFWEEFKTLWKEMLLALVFMVPQWMLYAKVGFGERYILPFSIGLMLFFTVFVSKSKILQEKRKIAYIATLFLLLAANGRAMMIEADYFRYRGQSVTKMLESLEVAAKSGSNVMSCLGISNPEADWVVKYYLANRDCGDKIFFWDYTREVVSVREPSARDMNAQTIPLEEIDAFCMYNQSDRHYTISPEFDWSMFQYIRCGSIDLYYRKENVMFDNIEIRLPRYYD